MTTELFGNAGRIFTLTTQGYEAYNAGNEAIKMPRSAQIIVQDKINEIRKAVAELRNYPELPAQEAAGRLAHEAEKLEKKLTRVELNAENFKKITTIYEKTISLEIRDDEVKGIINELEAVLSNPMATSLCFNNALQAYATLGRFVEVNNSNNNSLVSRDSPEIPNGGKYDEIVEYTFNSSSEEISSSASSTQIPKQNEDTQIGSSNEDLSVFQSEISEKSEIDVPISTSNTSTPTKPTRIDVMTDINNALKLLLSATDPVAFKQELKAFSPQIAALGQALQNQGFVNFEHMLHGQIYNAFTKLKLETKDVAGKPFGRYVMDEGVVSKHVLEKCCNNTRTYVYLNMLLKVLEPQHQNDNSLLEAPVSLNELMIEIEAYDLSTANAIYYQTWLCATKEEKGQTHSDFGKEAFRGINGVKVGTATKLKALQSVLNDRKKEYGIL